MFSIKGFSPSDWEILRKYLTIREADRNSVIYNSGMEAQTMFFVEDGSVKLVVRKSVDGGEDENVAVIKTGGFFGEEALLTENALYQYTAVAHEPSKICSLTREALQKLMMSSMPTGTKLLLGITRNFREAIAVSEQTGKLLAFYSPRGGSGKTCLAVNIAEALGRLNNKVALIDADFQFGNAHLFAGLKPIPNIARCLHLEKNLSFDRVKHYMQTRGRVDYLTVSDLPQEAEMVTRANLHYIIKELTKKYTYVIVDCKIFADDQTLLLWDISDRLFLVGQPDFLSLIAFRSLFSLFKRLNYPKEKFVCLLNKFQEDKIEYLEEFKKIFLVDPVLIRNDPQNVQDSLVKGVPCIALSPESPFSKSIDELMVHLVGDIKKPAEKGGIFSRLKSIFG